MIEFYFQGGRKSLELNSEDNYFPWTTVLQYLRSLPDRKGTKEGCAEGDCGACTVVLGELDQNNKMSYKAYDSCLLFLPMLHGKQLITVEDLGAAESLHPVQKAMVDDDGSQCGYCTPGFIMSIFSLYKEGGGENREEVLDALTGNLCRCTGYRSIEKACKNACKSPQPDKFSLNEKQVISSLNLISGKKKDLIIKGKDYEYYRPFTLAKASEILLQNSDIKIVNGGTDIGLEVTKQKKDLPKLLDLEGISELKLVDRKEDKVIFGAGVPLEEIRRKCKDDLPALYDMLSLFGSRQIRNRATLGGNIGTASPIGDTPPVLMAYDALVYCIGPDGERSLPIRKFITGYRQTDLKPGELISKIEIPFPKKESVRSYKVSKRKDLDISTVSGGFSLELNEKKEVENIYLAYGGMAAQTKRASGAESFLKGKAWVKGNIEEAMELIDKDFSPISDARASLDGRRIMARNLLLKFWVETNR